MHKRYQQIDVVVVGAGVIGLSVARALAMQGREVFVLEQKRDIAQHSSSRNSEVIHAGIYYPQGSLKAELCVKGKERLYNYCQENRIPYKRCGKLVVATDDAQYEKLLDIERRARDAKVDDLERWDQDRLWSLYPELSAEQGLFSPSTGIIDSFAYARSLQADLEALGGVVVLDAPVHSIKAQEQGATFLVGRDEDAFKANTFINSAGLWGASLFHNLKGHREDLRVKAHFAKGHYFSYSAPTPFESLIYPIPNDAGLGIHLTLDLAGRARFGPDVYWTNQPDDYDLSSANKDQFVEAISCYWPSVNPEKLEPEYAGVRPKLAGPGKPAGDFTILGPAEHGLKGIYHLLGIESPGLTASLAIADYVAQKVKAAA